MKVDRLLRAVPKFLLLSAGAASCSNGWVKYSTSCYYFSSSKLIYSTAQTKCQTLNSRANLACVGSADENSFIKTKAEENELENGVWIGYSDSSVESDWIWEDSTCTSTYSNWALNEPNGGDSDDCAKLDIRTGRSGNWYDLPCSSDYSFVCEYADEDEENADDNDDGSGGSAGTDGGIDDEATSNDGTDDEVDDDDEDDDTGAEKAEFEPMAFVWIGLAILLVLTVFFYFWKGRKGDHARSRILNQQQGIEIELGEVTPRTIPVRASRMIHGDRTIPVAPAANARIDCGAGHAEVISIEPIPSPLYLPGDTHVSSHSGMTEGERPIDLALPSAKAVVAVSEF